MKFLFFVLISISLGFTACSDDGSVDQCVGITCDFGVCERSTGVCTNPSSCEEAQECLAGFTCLFEKCKAEVECAADGTCPRGACIEGACVNPATCEFAGQCLENHGCVGSSCVFDRCAEVECPRGECSKDSGECVNKTVCSEPNQVADCAAGFVCYGQVCVEESVVCRDITCDRGVCDPAAKGCANAEMCASDTNCLDNFFCNDTSVCQQNICDAQMVECGRGVCDLRSGECINATNCTTQEGCTDGFSCVGGACLAQGAECGTDGCVGNQVCTLNETTLTATCGENPSGCSTAVDCDGERVCRNGGCQTAPACAGDGFEPNETIPTDYQTAVVDSTIEATICRGDIDLYTFDSRLSPLFTGSLLAVLAFDERDLGLGNVKLEVVDSTGVVVASGQNDSSGVARVEYQISALRRGIYTIRVSDVDVKLAGVLYRLYVDLLDPVAAQACLNPTPLTSGDRLTGNSTSGSSYQLGSSCTSANNPSGENIYAFTLDSPKLVDLSITPLNGAALSFSIRRQCEISASDIVCKAPLGSGVMSHKKVMDPGTYFLIVQGTTGNPGGSYDLGFDTTETVCSAADNACVGANLNFTYFCNDEGTGFLTAQCPNGCEPNSGNCIRKPTDVCLTATDASAGYSGTIAWNTLSNDYDPGTGGCVPDSSGTQTNGPDATYRVEVPSQSRVRANLTRATGDYVALYAVTSCSDLSTCVAGANSSAFTDEELIYLNATNATQTIFVIADIERDTSYGTSTISIDVAPVVCVPSGGVCVGTMLQTCNTDGTAETSQNCSFGCTAGLCNPVINDQCTGAVDLGSISFTGRIDEYGDDYTPGFSGCTGRSAYGPDATFTVTPPAGQVVTATVQAAFDASIYAIRNCSSASTTCVAGSDGVNVLNETTRWVADGSPYFVVVDASSSLASGDFTVSVTWQSPQCTPGASLGCADSSTLSFCSQLGLPSTMPCGGACVTGACTMPAGQVCADAITLSDGFIDTNKPFSGTNTVNPGVGLKGSCNFPSSEEPVGSDTIYVASLRAGEYLFASYTATSSYAMMYLLGTCGAGTSCLSTTADGLSGKLAYQATQDEVIYLVMDRSTTGTTTLSYTLNVAIKAPNCTPGQPSVCSTADTLQFCNAYGILEDFTCTGGCTAGTCAQPGGNVCADPIVLTSGVPVSGSINRSLATNAIEFKGPRTGQCLMDDTVSTVGYDTIYAVDLLPGDILRANLTTISSSAFIGILENCAATSCLASPVSLGGTTSLSAHSPAGGRYYIVVDASSTTTSPTAFTLTVDVIPGGFCNPDASSCDPQTNEVTICDTTGYAPHATYACAGACDDTRCALNPLADVCATAPNVGTGTLVLGNYSTLTADITLPDSTCAGTTASGPEAVYAVDVQAGQVLHAKLKSFGQETPALYVLTDCAATTSCIAGALAFSYVSELYHVVTSTQTVYVVADSTSTFSDEPFELLIETLLPECVVGDKLCDIDGVSLKYCNNLGLFESYACAGGCTANSCNTPRGEICADAIVLTNGTSFSGAYSSFKPDTDPEVGSCVVYDPRQQDGPDAVFAVDLVAGDRLDAVLTTTTTASGMYILDACGGDTKAACREAAVYGDNTLNFIADATQRYYLVVDSEYTITAAFTVAVNIVPGQTCVPGGSTCRSGVLSMCDAVGSIFASASCANGCGNSTACAANPIINDSCSTATPISASTVIIDSYGRYTNTLNPGSVCAKQSAPGREGVYAVSLTAGSVLTASVVASDPTTNPSLYLITDCANAVGTCLAGAASLTPEVKLQYLATTTGLVYLVADNDWATDDDAFYLDIKIQPQECTPGQKVCGGSDLLTCNSYGIYDRSTCYFGCANAVCNGTPNDLCTGATDVSAGGTFRAPVSFYTDVYNPMVNNVSCTGDDAAGRDAVYKMNLNQGDFVSLTLQGPGDPVLYVSTACGTNAVVASGCVSGSDDTNTPETLEFNAPSTGVFYVFADLDTTSTIGDFVLDVVRRPANTCAPNSTTCLDANSLQFCDNKGTTLVDVTCLGGCSAGKCGQPKGETCADPINATGGGLFSIPLDSFTNDYNLTSTSCVGYDTPGNDVVFRVDLAPGESLDARVTGPSAENPALYLVKNCGGIRDQITDHACVDGTDANGAVESLSYIPTGPETVYVVLDSRSTFSDDGVFAVDIFAGPPCTLGVTSCSDANTLTYCPSGTRKESYACNGGCSAGACGSPTGDVCIDAIPAIIGTNSGSYAGTNGVDLGVAAQGTCNFAAGDAQVGTDHTYYVDLTAGQVLNTSFTTNSGFGIMYLTKDCAAGSQCLSNTAGGGGGSLSYTATTTERVYIVIDRTLSGSDSFYTYVLNVSVL
jgi:hypothetical protein